MKKNTSQIYVKQSNTRSIVNKTRCRQLFGLESNEIAIQITTDLCNKSFAYFDLLVETKRQSLVICYRMSCDSQYHTIFTYLV